MFLVAVALVCAFVEARAKVQEGIKRLCENGSCKRWQWTTGQPLFCDERFFRCALNGLSRILPNTMFAVSSESGLQHALPMKHWHIFTITDIWQLTCVNSLVCQQALPLLFSAGNSSSARFGLHRLELKKHKA